MLTDLFTESYMMQPERNEVGLGVAPSPAFELQDHNGVRNRSSRPKVCHNYCDHLKEYMPDLGTQSTNALEKVDDRQLKLRFPDRLYNMLCKVDASGMNDIVSWQPHGRCFVVHNPEDFAKRIMPKYFKQSIITSFQRQLNIYGFKRLTTGQDASGYYHEYFLRGCPDLCRKIEARRIKGTAVKPIPSPQTEPNFYVMQYTPALLRSEENGQTGAMEDLPDLRLVRQTFRRQTYSSLVPETDVASSGAAFASSHGEGNGSVSPLSDSYPIYRNELETEAQTFRAESDGLFGSTGNHEVGTDDNVMDPLILHRLACGDFRVPL